MSGKSCADIVTHARVSSWFLGPRAENFPFLSEFMLHVLNDQRKARESTYPDDPDFIKEEVMETEEFLASMDGLRRNVKALSKRLAKNSIPFYSPRYNGHMLMDTTIPSIVGYMAAMMYNPNNVATEASPVTTEYERAVGMQLCELLGYGGAKLPWGSPPEPNMDSLGREITPWGHITCDGSVANLEAIWATRNLKFYPLSLKLAMEENGPLNFLARTKSNFQVKTCQGVKKLFKELSIWELLNLTPETVLDLPTYLYKRYLISPSFLEKSLKSSLVQTVGTRNLENQFNLQPGHFFISATKHYSWPKGGAITGLGSASFIDVKVDHAARMNLKDLDRRLRESLDNKVPVFGVVAIIGSTEHGACDPLEGIVALRKRYQAEGLSFAIHCDAAWGILCIYVA
ncbi:L-tyrosine decarboxylase [Cladobotryum mycophilum]|uniref:L-tyrosine decarboxylase n=1 Tax=Cladobotryum mycophilum TaxID=491253 RepID=A0ABR0SPN9_9HYPO